MGFLGISKPTPLTTPNGIRIQLAVLPQYTLRTDTHRLTWSRRETCTNTHLRCIGYSDTISYFYVELRDTYFWPTVLSVAPLAHCVVCLSSVCLSVTFCIVVKRYVLAKNCLKERIGNQGQKVDFWVAAIFLLPVLPLRPPRRLFCLIFARTAQQSVLDG